MCTEQKNTKNEGGGNTCFPWKYQYQLNGHIFGQNAPKYFHNILVCTVENLVSESTEHTVLMNTSGQDNINPQYKFTTLNTGNIVLYGEINVLLPHGAPVVWSPLGKQS